jgi:two-component sensor histidine kinase
MASFWLNSRYLFELTKSCGIRMLIKDLSSTGRLRIAQAIETAVPAAWDYDRNSDVFLSTRRTAEIYGFGAEAQVNFMDFLKATHRDDTDWSHDLLQGRAHLPKDGIYHYRIVRADDGEVRSIRSKIIVTSQPNSPNAASAYTGIVEDITEQTRATHALTESETRLRLAIEAGKMAVWEVDLETGRVTNTPELNQLFGLPKEANPSFAELRAHYAPGEVERLEKEGATLEVVRKRYARGEFKPRPNYFDAAEDDRTQVQAELSIITPAGQTKRLLYRAQYTFSLEGRPQITGLLVDITDRKLAEERLSTVARELQHRVKNSLAIVQSLAFQTFRASITPSAVETFQARLRALATATDLILSNEKRSANLLNIVEQIIDPYRTSGHQNFSLKGPSIHLPENAVTAIAMVLHELCTNAVKYGALSTDTGNIFLEWQRTPDARLSLRWEEKDEAVAQTSLKKGFGTQLIRLLVTNDLGGSVDFNWLPTGLQCQISTGSIVLDL